MSNQLDYDAIRVRADIRVKKRVAFNLHLAIYILANLALWFIFGLLAGFLHSPFFMLVPIITTFAWGLGVAIHGLVVYMDTHSLDNMREREFQREVQREMRRRGINQDEAEQAVYEKPKRDHAARLSDDGELTYDDLEQPPATDRRARR